MVKNKDKTVIKALDNIDEMIGLLEHKIKLYRDLKKALFLQYKTYYVTEINQQFNNRKEYVLCESKGHEKILVDTLDKINSYLNIRNLLDDTVFDYGTSLKVKRQ